MNVEITYTYQYVEISTDICLSFQVYITTVAVDVCYDLNILFWRTDQLTWVLSFILKMIMIKIISTN